ncbi:MAG: hypothetical protein ACP6IP_07505 [Candidatus Njordarchaeia archaeon]
MEDKEENPRPNPWYFVAIFYIFTTAIMLYLYSHIPENETFILRSTMSKLEFLTNTLIPMLSLLLLPIAGEWHYRKAITKKEKIISIYISGRGATKINILMNDYRKFIAIQTILYASLVFTIYTYFTIAKILTWDTSYWFKPGAKIQTNAIFFIAPLTAIVIASIYAAHYYNKKTEQTLEHYGKT